MIRCRDLSRPCRAELQCCCRGTGTGVVELWRRRRLPSSSPSLLRFFPFFSSLGGGGGRGNPWGSRVSWRQPWGLCRRGARVLARTPKRNGGDGMAATGDAWWHQGRSARGFWARDQAGSRPHGSSSRQLRQAVASARQHASRRGAPRTFAMRRREKIGEARRFEERGKADRWGPPVSGCWRRTGVGKGVAGRRV